MMPAAPTPPERTTDVPWVAIVLVGIAFFMTQHSIMHTRHYLERGAIGFIATQEETDELMQGFDQGKKLNALIYLGLGALGVGMMLWRRQQPMRIDLYSELILLFLFWCFVSVFWAEDRGSTVKKLIIFAMLCIAVAGIVRRFSDRDIVLFTLLIMGAYVSIGVLSEIGLRTFRPWFSGYRFSGTCHPNGQALDCALLFFAAIFTRDKRYRYLLWGIAAFAFVCLVLTKSRTSLLGAMLAPGVFYAIVASPYKKFTAVLFVGAVGSLFLLAGDAIAPLIQKGALMGRTDTEIGQAKNLTGRTDLWKELKDTYIAKRPVLGYGYNSFWNADRVDDIFHKIDFMPGNAHNIFIELVVGLGPLAALMYIVINLVAIKRSISYYLASLDTSFAFYGSMLILSMIHGLTESTFQFPSMPTFIGMVVLARLGFQAPPEPTAEPVEEPVHA